MKNHLSGIPMSSSSCLPERLRHLSAQDFLTLRSSEKFQLVTWLKEKQWQEIQNFAAHLNTIEQS